MRRAEVDVGKGADGDISCSYYPVETLSLHQQRICP